MNTRTPISVLIAIQARIHEEVVRIIDKDGSELECFAGELA